MNNQKKKQTKGKIFVAMSGGVDSSVSAAMLVEQGYDVTGVFMKNWSGDDLGIRGDCPWEEDQADAEAVCKKIGINFRSVNFEKQYREKVISYFFEEYRLGRTPNPDVLCNKEIKFGLFLEWAIGHGAEKIATGHYARVEYDKSTMEFSLLKGIDASKDQSYFLHLLTQDQLGRTLFPVGGLKKTEVRELAVKYDLPTSTKPDSQGICFVGEINVGKFLRANLPEQSGEIVDIDTGKVVGKHDSVVFYTIGQREGLKIGGAPQPYFVAGKDKKKNILFVASGRNNKHLFKSVVSFSQLHQINNNGLSHEDKLSASIRYRQKPDTGKLDLESNSFEFDHPQRAVSEGQAIVFYKDDICLGGAVID